MPFQRIHVLNRYARVLELIRRQRRIFVASVVLVFLLVVSSLTVGIYFYVYKDPYPLVKAGIFVSIILGLFLPPFIAAMTYRRRAAHDLLYFWTEMLIRNYLITYLLDPNFLSHVAPRNLPVDLKLNELEWNKKISIATPYNRFTDFWGLRGGWTTYVSDWAWRLLELHPYFEVIPVVRKLMRKPWQVAIRAMAALVVVAAIFLFFEADLPNIAKLFAIVLWWYAVYIVFCHLAVWSVSNNIIKAILMLVCLRDYNYDYPLGPWRGLDFQINYEDLYDLVENEINPVKIYMPTSRLRTDRSQYN